MPSFLFEKEIWNRFDTNNNFQSYEAFSDPVQSTASEWASLPFLADTEQEQTAPTMPIHTLNFIEPKPMDHSPCFLNFHGRLESVGEKQNLQPSAQEVGKKIFSFCKRSFGTLKAKIGQTDRPLVSKDLVQEEGVSLPESDKSLIFDRSAAESEGLLWKDLTINQLESEKSRTILSQSREDFVEISLSRASTNQFPSVRPKPSYFRIPGFAKPQELREFKLRPPAKPSAFDAWFKKTFSGVKEVLSKPPLYLSAPSESVSDSVGSAGAAQGPAFEAYWVDDMHVPQDKLYNPNAWSISIADPKGLSELPFYGSEKSSFTASTACSLDENHEPADPQKHLKIGNDEHLYWRLLERKNRRLKKRLRSKTKKLIDQESAKSISLPEAMWSNIDAMTRALSSAGSACGLGEYPSETLTRGRLRKKKKEFFRRRDLGLVGPFDLEQESPFSEYLEDEEFDLFG